MDKTTGSVWLLCAGLLLTGGALLWGALLQREPMLAEGWEPVNGRLEASLAASADGERGADGARNGEGGGAEAAGGDAAVSGGSAGGAAGSAGGTSSAGAAANSAAAGGIGGAGAAHGTAAAGGAESAAGVSAAAPNDSGGAAASPASADSGLLDLNTATAEQLDALPGIGPAKAQAILEDRERNGPFRSVDDLTRVKGIGPKMLANIRGSVTVRK